MGIMTPNMQVVYDYVKAVYKLPIGVTRCRKIADSKTWSQHSWSNANDIYTTSRTLQDKIAADLHDTFGDDIHIILTYRSNAAHYNHLHVDMWPKGYGTPPCAGGIQRIKYANQVIVSGPFPLTVKEDDMAILTNDEQVELQTFLKELRGINSNTTFVRYLIPWFRKWRGYVPEDFDTLPDREVVTITRSS